MSAIENSYVVDFNYIEEDTLQKKIISYNVKTQKDIIVLFGSNALESKNGIFTSEDFDNFLPAISKTKSQDVDILINADYADIYFINKMILALKNKYKHINVIANTDIKSAFVSLLFVADNIYLSKNSKIHHLDTVVTTSRIILSAFHYLQWINEKNNVGVDNLSLSDALILKSITPDEIFLVEKSYKFTQNISIKLLLENKFSTLGDASLAEENAENLVSDFIDNNNIEEDGIINLTQINGFENLKIKNIEDESFLSKTINEILELCSHIENKFDSKKIIASENNVFIKDKKSILTPKSKQSIKSRIHVIEIEKKCPQCETIFKVYANLDHNESLDYEYQRRGFTSFPKNSKIQCLCGNVLDFEQTKLEIETQTGKKIFDE